MNTVPLNNAPWYRTSYGKFKEGEQVTDHDGNTGVVAYVERGDATHGYVPVIFDGETDKGIIPVPAEMLIKMKEMMPSGIEFPPEIPRVGQVVQIHLPEGTILETIITQRDTFSGDPRFPVILNFGDKTLVSTLRPNIWKLDSSEVKVFPVS